MSIIHQAPGANFAVGGDLLDQDYNESSNFGIISVQVESNRFTSSAYPPPTPAFMRWGSFRNEQFGKGIHSLVDDEVFFRVDLTNNRYRSRRTGGDVPDDGILVPLAIGEWSVWQGGIPGAPTSNSLVAVYRWFFNQFGTKSGTFQLQVEEPDHTDIVVSDRSMFLSITRTP